MENLTRHACVNIIEGIYGLDREYLAEWGLWRGQYYSDYSDEELSKIAFYQTICDNENTRRFVEEDKFIKTKRRI